MKILFQLLLIMSMAVVVLLPAQAQGTCDFDLVEAITSLIEAQRMADQGDTFNAARAVEAAQAELADVVEACGDADFKLGRSFTTTDGLFTFGYPRGWALSSLDTGLYFLANSQVMLDEILENDLENVPSGGQFILVAAAPFSEYYSRLETFDEFKAEFEAEGLGNEMNFVGPIGETPINSQETYEYNIVGHGVEGGAFVMNPDQNNSVVVVVGLASPGEYDVMEPITLAVARSALFGDVEATTTSAVTGLSLDEIEFAGAIRVDDLIPDADFRTAMLSPDGAQIAWANRDDPLELCVAEIDNPNPRCTPIPQQFDSSVTSLMWSPDSRYLAFTPNFFMFFHEPDIWVMDVEDGQILNMTNDGTDMPLLSSGFDAENTFLDHTMTWGPDNQLYFIRHQDIDDIEFTTLNRLDPETGETESIIDLSNRFQRFSIYDTNQEYNLDGSMSLSPDGDTLALLVREFDRDSNLSGIYTLDLTDPDAAPKRVVGVQAFNLGLPRDLPQDDDTYLMPMGIQWSGDGSGLFVHTISVQTIPELTPTLWQVYHVGLDSGDLTVLTDFSDLTQEELMTTEDAAGRSLAYQVPRGVVLSPDGTTPIVFNAMLNDAGFYALEMLDDGSVLRVVLTEFEYDPVPASLSSSANNGGALMYGYVLMTDE